MRNRLTTVATAAVAALALGAGAAAADTTVPDEPDIVDVAGGADGFTMLVAAVQAAGLEETLRGEGPFTVFAPTDDAIAALPEGTVAALLADPTGDLARILTYHVVAGEVWAADVAMLDGVEVATAAGATFTVGVGEDGAVTLTDGAGNVINVVATDVAASNGVIHVIDGVLMPPPLVDVVDTAVGAQAFATLVAAVQAAGLEETLRGEGPFTVFAPTDDVFAALPEGTVEGLLADPAGDLTAILTYHVVAGEVWAADVAGLDGVEVETVNGATFTVGVGEDGAVTLTDGAGNVINVVATDVAASNGVIHVIDGILMPG